ncbi:MAG: molybdopterin-binding protein [Planctomycetota bacterium]
MRYGARNAIVGKVTKVEQGPIMGKATISVEGKIELSSVMTVDSIEELELKEGDQVRAVIKAIHVLLVKE